MDEQTPKLGTAYPDLFAALAAPFEPSEVKTFSKGGRQLHYVTARTIANRLDEVLGPENWWDAYPTMGTNSVVCALTIRLPDGREVTKHDAGGPAGMSDEGDDDKSMFSDAFKRVAARWNCGRYLYRDGVPSFTRGQATNPTGAPQGGNGNRAVKAPPTNGKELFARVRKYDERNGTGLLRHLSQWADENGLPEKMVDFSAEQVAAAWTEAKALLKDRAVGAGPQPADEAPAPGEQGPPRTGRALFAWVRDQEERHGAGLLKYLNGFMKLQEFPARMVDLEADQVVTVYAEAVRKLKTAASAESYEEALAN